MRIYAKISPEYLPNSKESTTFAAKLHIGMYKIENNLHFGMCKMRAKFDF